MDPIHRLASYFSKFPGIGERQSKRFVHFLLTRDQSYLEELSKLIASLRREISQCADCYRHFPVGSIAGNICDVCRNPELDSSSLMIIEKDVDYESIRRSAVYKGKFFVLGGLVPLVEKGLEKRVRINELMDRINKGGIAEVILAFSLSPQGDHTDTYVREMLSSLKEKHGFKIASLGRGLSTGTELEYSDNETIRNALKNRA